MESLGQNGGMEGMITSFINGHPEYAKENFTQEEIRQAAILVSARDISVAEDMLQRALDARLAVRGVKENTPVINNQDAVIGMASTPEEARTMYRRDNETRDSM